MNIVITIPHRMNKVSLEDIAIFVFQFPLAMRSSVKNIPRVAVPAQIFVLQRLACHSVVVKCACVAFLVGE